MQSTSGTPGNAPLTADRELLADAPCNEAQRVNSFTELFQRAGASTPWEKFTHTLLMPLRRYWARQQVAKVLEIAQAKGVAGLASVQSLQQEFDANAGIRQSKAKAAAIEMMLNGVMPDERWGTTFDAYLDDMQAWYEQNFISKDLDLTEHKSPERASNMHGLKVMLDFARRPGCAVSISDLVRVNATMAWLKGKDYDNTQHPGPPYHEALSKIFERYSSAAENAERVVEKSSQMLTTPAMQRRAGVAKDVVNKASDWLRSSPEFIDHPELIAEFNDFIEAKERPVSPAGFSTSEKRLLNQFLGRFALAFQKNPNELVALLSSAIILQDALLDREDLQKTIDLHTNKQEHKLLKGLQTSGFSPSCVLALAEYLLVSRSVKSTPASTAHPSKLNPESWMRLRYLYDHRENWQRSLPLGDSTETAAADILRRLGQDIAAFENKVIRSRFQKNSKAIDNDNM